MRLSTLSPTFLFSSYIYLHTTSQSYKATGPAPSVGEARFRAEFIPRGSQADMTVSAAVVGGAAITESGPYQLRLHAFGQQADYQWFRVTRFVLRVSGRQDALMGKRGFEGKSVFIGAPKAEMTRAALLFGTRIFINVGSKDHEIAIEADVEVMRRGGMSRGTIRIPMKREDAARSESIFIPGEIVRSFRAETPADIPSPLSPPPEAP